MNFSAYLSSQNYFIMKEVLTMTETDLAAALRHCIDDCGCSWPTACQILSRMAGRAYTLAELRDLYRCA